MTWVEREEPWHRIEVQYCEVTGQLLPRRYWEFEHGGRVIMARDPRCEVLFREYVLPREGVPESSTAAGEESAAANDGDPTRRS